MGELWLVYVVLPPVADDNVCQASLNVTGLGHNSWSVTIVHTYHKASLLVVVLRAVLIAFAVLFFNLDQLPEAGFLVPKCGVLGVDPHHMLTGANLNLILLATKLKSFIIAYFEAMLCESKEELLFVLFVLFHIGVEKKWHLLQLQIFADEVLQHIVFIRPDRKSEVLMLRHIHHLLLLVPTIVHDDLVDEF